MAKLVFQDFQMVVMKLSSYESLHYFDKEFYFKALKGTIITLKNHFSTPYCTLHAKVI
jgi:hypothetical protein